MERESGRFKELVWLHNTTLSFYILKHSNTKQDIGDNVTKQAKKWENSINVCAVITAHIRLHSDIHRFIVFIGADFKLQKASQ
ncbi:hypothetical protein XELAEV_18005416mg [Xenopus laevis]|uniref:Uncharacterized protein n=1 Tax=Xenopus laevis TaxID=8355 RepID=A0A974I380_XENLA|nr:hypothetical protein XELAEV_18005416mg [Xenopus laevis]